MFDVYERPVGFINRKTENLVPIDGYKALVKADEAKQPKTLAIVKNSYKVVQNTELFPAVNELINNNLREDQTKDIRITDRSAYDGGICYREYIFPNMQVLGRHNKPIAFRIIIKNSFGRTALTMHYGAIDFYCTNGMILGDFSSQYAKHTSGLHIKSFVANLSSATQNFNMFAERINDWMYIKVDPSDVELFLDNCTPMNDTLRHRLHELYHKYANKPTHGHTVYSFYSALTHYASHTQVKETKNDHAAATRLNREDFVRKIVEQNPQFFPKVKEKV